MQASKKFYDKYSENSRSQIVFRTDIFRKLTLGAPESFTKYNTTSLLAVREGVHEQQGVSVFGSPGIELVGVYSATVV